MIRDMWQYNLDVFYDTRSKSVNEFNKDTNELLKNTFVYNDARDLVYSDEMVYNGDMEISVINGGTVSTAYSIKKNHGGKVAMLNFADALVPGGLVLDGASTQEENICRCTNLYESLIQKKCKEQYYDVNKQFGSGQVKYRVEKYTNALIYSENVTIFKDDVTYKDIPPQYVDVITSPSPFGVFPGVDKVLKYRIEGIIKVAYVHGIEHIVLGAWGCGAFMQNPKTVSRCFKEVLAKFPVFKSVTFAIRPTVGNSKDKTFKIFYNTFRPGTPLF